MTGQAAIETEALSKRYGRHRGSRTSASRSRLVAASFSLRTARQIAALE